MKSSFFTITIASSVVVTLCACVTLYFTHVEVKLLRNTVSSLESTLHEVVMNNRASLVYTDISTQGDSLNRNFFCLNSIEIVSPEELARAKKYYEEMKDLPDEDSNKRGLLNFINTSNTSTDLAMIKYVREKIINNDSTVLCGSCYRRHQKRFDFLIDSISKVN